jgi:hypothetical protein
LDSSFSSVAAVAGIVAGALLGIGQAQQVTLVGPAAGLLGRGHGGAGVLGDGTIVAAAADCR